VHKKPKYRLVAEDLKRKILQGKLNDQIPIPNQGDIAKEYNASEITSRRALAELVSEGLIYRVRGKGTFVKNAIGHSLQQAEGSESVEVKNIYLIHKMLKPQFFNHRFYSDLLQGLNELCLEQGVKFYLWDIGPNYILPPCEEAGIVILPSTNEATQLPSELLARWNERYSRLATVHFYYPHLKIPYVLADNLMGGFLATQHLLTLGHRRVGIVVTGKSMVDINQEFSLRLQGYRRALLQNQVEFDPELVVVVDGYYEDEEMGESGFKQLMQLDNPPTAIFTTSDYKAFGAIKAAQRQGMDVPGDISIIGYDDVLAGSYFVPALTTINQNMDQVGRKVGQIVLGHLEEGGEAMQLKEEVTPTLVIRESTQELLKN